MLVADIALLPAWIDLAAFPPEVLATRQIFQIVEREATLTVRTPEPLLWLIARSGCRIATPRSSRPAPATVTAWLLRQMPWRRDGLCLPVAHSFRSTEDEVNYQLAAGCGCKDHAWCRLPRWGQQMSEALQALLAAPTPPPVPGAEPTAQRTAPPTAADAGAHARLVLVAGKPPR